jgi:DNA invertase Pin-like site-specific DNA recombinase
MEIYEKKHTIHNIITFNTALYMRLSKEDGDKDESDSIGNQRKLLENYLRHQEDMVLFDTYIDDGYSGTNFYRPGFQKLIDVIEQGHINCVVVKDLSRFGRDYLESGRYIQRYFPEKQVRFVAVNDNVDTKNTLFDIMLPIRNLFNEQYSRDISTKVQSSFKIKQRSGEFIGAFPSYGYQKSSKDRHKLIVDPYASEIVKRIFAMYVAGHGKVRIAYILNKDGILCPSTYKRQMETIIQIAISWILLLIGPIPQSILF